MNATMTKKIHFALFKSGSTHAQEDCSQSTVRSLATRAADETTGNDHLNDLVQSIN